MTPSFNPTAGGVQRTTSLLGSYFFKKNYKVSYFSLENENHVQPQHGLLFHAKEDGGVQNKNNLLELENFIIAEKPQILINQMPYEIELRNTIFDLKKRYRFIIIACIHNSLFSFKSNIKDILNQSLSKKTNVVINNKLTRQLLLTQHRLKQKNVLKTIIDGHDKTILLTPKIIEELKYFVGSYKLEKIKTIPNSISINPIKNIPKKNILLHVGRLNIPQKRSDLLLEVWKQCYKDMPDWEFKIVGDGPYINHLKNQIKNDHLPRVSIEGFQNPESYYKEAKLFIMPSAFEGFPNTLLEAQNFGCVCFAFDTYASLKWIVNHNIDAILVKPFNTSHMAKQIINISKDEEKIKLLSINSRKNTDRFHLNSIGLEWINLFNELNE